MKKTLQIFGFCLWVLLLFSEVGFTQKPLPERNIGNTTRVISHPGDHIEHMQNNNHQNPVQFRQDISSAASERRLNSMTDFQEKVRNASKAKSASLNGPGYMSVTIPDFGKSHQVTFNVNMEGAVAEGGVVFDPEIHQVYITGSFTGWVVPGSDVTYQMLPVDKVNLPNPGKDPLIYSITLTLEQGSHQYKYFLVQSEPTWAMGEWSGDPNRVIYVDGDMEINNDWGILGDPDPGPHEVVFNVTDPYYYPIGNAVITIYPMAEPDKAVIPMIKGQINNIPDFENNQNTSGQIFSISERSEPSSPAIRLNNQRFGEWIHWDDGENNSGVGLTNGGIFFVASRWTPDDLIPYSGMAITMLQIYIRDIPTSATVKIWQGNDASSLVELVSQPVSPVYEHSWQIIQLTTPYVIDVNQELWFGYEIDDPGPGFFPAGIDDFTNYPGKGDKVKLGYDGNWENLSGYGIPGDWNIQAFVTDEESIVLITDAAGQASFEALNGSYYYTVTKPGFVHYNGTFSVEGYPLGLYIILYEDSGLNSVTFYVDMTDAPDFDPDVHSVYLTGSFTGWAEPGTTGSIEMSLVQRAGRDSMSVVSDKDVLIYTATLDLPTGQHQYKYFSDAYGPGWEGGEWQGDPNRVIEVNDDMVINDVWGYYQPPSPGMQFNLPLPNQTYEVGVDTHIPVQIELTGNYTVYYYMYLVGYDFYEYFTDGYISQPGIYDFQYSINSFTPGGTYSFFMEYYIYETGSLYYLNSNIFTIINDASTIEVVQPGQGDIWFSGSGNYITWNSLNVNSVNIYYSLDDGQNWGVIATNIPSYNGYDSWGYNGFWWQIPPGIEGLNNQSLVRIEDSSFPSVEGYSEPFTIMPSPIQFNTPLPGQTYQVGVDEFIPVEVEITENLTIEYFLHIDVYGNWINFGYNYVTGPGIYNHVFEIPDILPPGNHSFLLEFYISDNGYYGLIQSNYFTIINNNTVVDVVVPMEDEVWVAGGWYEIRWNSLNVNNVNISYSVNNGAEWISIAQSVPSYEGYYYWGNNGYYWQVPAHIEGNNPQSLIKIESTANPSVYGLSDLFTIAGAPVKFINPVATTVLAVGDPLPIILDLNPESYLEIYIIDPYYGWYYVDFVFANAGIFTYNYVNTGWMSPGQYQVFVYHSSTGFGIYSDYFTVVPSGTVYDVTFNLDMSNAQEFDPNGHHVHMTGDFLNWAVPGSPGSAELNLSDPETMIYSKAISLKPGLRYYKYFSDAYGQEWNGGEWNGDPNRMIQVSGNMTVNDIWGVHAAVFFNLDLQSDPAGAGILSGSGTYNAHQIIELSATTNEGYVFIDWEDIHGNVISLDEICNYLMPARHTTLIAKFEVESNVEDLHTLDVKLFPNPANRIVKIISEAVIKEMSVSDITGKVVMLMPVKDKETNIIVEGFDPGMYIVRFYTENDVIVKKLQVSR
ncbi:MAG: T9SS type A sorting domain-containing protein [Bacteroidales bacterium]|nr:T9SS type A sorting domain-containing protein [Bacteroidales bacterium]